MPSFRFPAANLVAVTSSVCLLIPGPFHSNRPCRSVVVLSLSPLGAVTTTDASVTGEPHESRTWPWSSRTGACARILPGPSKTIQKHNNRSR